MQIYNHIVNNFHFYRQMSKLIIHTTKNEQSTISLRKILTRCAGVFRPEVTEIFENLKQQI